VSPSDDPTKAAAMLIVAAYDDAADATAVYETIASAEEGAPPAAVVTRAADGRLDSTSVAPAHQHGGAAAGAAAGAAVGALLGPGVVAATAVGAVVGAIRDRRGPLRPVVDAIQNTLPPNSAGVVIITAADSSERFDAALRESRRVTKSGIDGRTLEHLRARAG
jgi:uncharacterized membrane protein